MSSSTTRPMGQILRSSSSSFERCPSDCWIPKQCPTGISFGEKEPSSRTSFELRTLCQRNIVHTVGELTFRFAIHRYSPHMPATRSLSFHFLYISNTFLMTPHSHSIKHISYFGTLLLNATIIPLFFSMNQRSTPQI